MTNIGNLGTTLTAEEQLKVIALALAIESITNLEQPRTGSNYRTGSDGAEYVARAGIFEQYISGKIK